MTITQEKQNNLFSCFMTVGGFILFDFFNLDRYVIEKSMLEITEQIVMESVSFNMVFYFIGKMFLHHIPHLKLQAILFLVRDMADLDILC